MAFGSERCRDHRDDKAQKMSQLAMNSEPINGSAVRTSEGTEGSEKLMWLAGINGQVWVSGKGGRTGAGRPDQTPGPYQRSMASRYKYSLVVGTQCFPLGVILWSFDRCGMGAFGGTI